MSNTSSLSGKTAIVTGAASGIGRAIAVRLASEGATVYAAGRTEASLAGVVGEIAGAGGKAHPVAVDVRKPAEIQAAVDRAVRETDRLDIFVNNAGLSYPGPIADGDPARWREMLEVNVLGLLVGCKAAIGAMRATKARGHIVNISSIAGRSMGAAGVYGATKSAVNALAGTLRAELEGDSIRIVNVLPGAVITNFGRNYPAEFVKGFGKSLGMDIEFEPGQHLAPEVIEQIAERARPIMATGDDVARAVLFAVTQPIELNIAEIVVRPQRQLQL